MDSAKQTILVPVVGKFPHSAFSFAMQMSQAYEKKIALLFFKYSSFEKHKSKDFYCFYSDKDLDQAITDHVEQCDSVMVVWEHSRLKKRIQQALNASRELRIPYFFISDNQHIRHINKVLVPVTNLVEEREKAPWARSLNRALGATFSLIQPNDKGTRARRNISHISRFLYKNNILFSISEGKRPSTSVEQEAICKYSEDADMLMMTASREYGLDDYFFGPKERKVIVRSPVPVMLLNPRSDLYVLCGD